MGCQDAEDLPVWGKPGPVLQQVFADGLEQPHLFCLVYKGHFIAAGNPWPDPLGLTQGQASPHSSMPPVAGSPYPTYIPSSVPATSQDSRFQHTHPTPVCQRHPTPLVSTALDRRNSQIPAQVCSRCHPLAQVQVAAGPVPAAKAGTEITAHLLDLGRLDQDIGGGGMHMSPRVSGRAGREGEDLRNGWVGLGFYS